MALFSSILPAGHPFFFQARDFRPDSNVVTEMDHATRHADRTLLVLSAASLSFGFVSSEMGYSFAPGSHWQREAPACCHSASKHVM